MKKYFILLILILLRFPFAQTQNTMELGDSAFASLLTVGAGDEFYEVFGHTALRFCDSANNIDLVFNYGSFDDFEDNFYLKFARGKLNYCVIAQYFNDFIFEYTYFGRQVWEQRLMLTDDELRSLFHALVVNVQPENMYYAYDFFRDNCATRVHDMVVDNLKGRSLILPPGIPEPRKRTTLRDLVHKYTNGVMPWWQTGIDILLGARCDRPINREQHLFAPIEMMNQYDTIALSDGARVAGGTTVLLSDTREPQRALPSPTLVTGLLLAAVVLLSVMALRRGWKLLWLDGTLFTLAGLTSLLLLFLWFGSDHWCTKWNMNLLWANPLLLFLLARLRKPNRKATIAALCCIGLMLLMWLVGLPQHFSTPLMLIALTLATRLAFRLKKDGYLK